jgi:hypothetical protein
METETSITAFIRFRRGLLWSLSSAGWFSLPLSLYNLRNIVLDNKLKNIPRQGIKIAGILEFLPNNQNFAPFFNEGGKFILNGMHFWIY